ncbi:E3 ubiquitin-protein ligase rnf146 [Aplochiton taeniatus]
MASCGEVDRSVSSLPSAKKGSNTGGGEGSDVATEQCSAEGGGSSAALPVPECAICLQSCVHPVQLPCSHVFCFLCVKGASWQSKRCALCRQEVPEDFLERPTLLSPEELKATAGGRGGAAGDHAWYYEGRNGWWQYDERTSRELEDAHAKGKKTAEMLIAGFLYVADLENMVQYRRNEHGRRRKMKRDVVDIPKKGVAGLRLDAEAGAAGAGRENSADGADHVAAQAPGPPAASQAPVPPVPARPPISLGGLPGTSTQSLEEALSQLHIASAAPTPQRPEEGEGEEEEEVEVEEEEEEEPSPTRSSDPHTSVDESVSGDWSDDEEEEDEEGDAGDGERVEPQEEKPWRQRLSPEDRALSGAEASSSSPSSSGRSRRPDGQCTVTEV